MEAEKHMRSQYYCSSIVDKISCLYLDVGDEADGVDSGNRLKGSMIEEILIRSDADFISLSRVSS